MSEQNYEEYWSLTNAYTNYNGNKFLKTLEICIQFIDEYIDEAYSPEKYSRLQHQVLEAVPKNAANIEDQLFSTRKAINLLVKLGFINSFLASYQKESIEYLNARTNRKRSTILSKIVYSYSSFNKSINDDSKLHQLNFLINTLVEVGKLSKEDIIALMLVDIESVEKGYLLREELDFYVNKAKEINFIKRKYNQISYLTNLLRKLDDIDFVNNELYFTEDAKQIFGENLEITTRKRNPYLHLIYKNQLKEESFAVYEVEKCMVEQLSYPTLIASHIKPFIKSNEDEAYDPNNGILLSRNIDSLFDLGYITFENDGQIRFANSEKLKNEVKDFISNYSLDNRFINSKRLEYLEYHRNEVFEKRYKYA
jgi:putative restriction endonuclease